MSFCELRKKIGSLFDMNVESLHKQIETAVPSLLNLARETTYSNIANNCLFILTEIKDIEGNGFVRSQLEKKENDAKQPVTLDELMPALLKLYDNLYDINLEIYRAKKDVTIIDFRYYPKTSLDEDYREKVKSNPPMLHYKVAHPFWLTNPKDKFHIKWKHDEGLNKLRRLWVRLKLR